MEDVRASVDEALSSLFPPSATASPGHTEMDAQAAVQSAMRYAVLGGGKRIRPAVLVAAYGAAGGSDDHEARGASAAVELLHAYSLVHDDLPAMDNSDLRRGRPTVHRIVGEANAILVGDGLLTLAFEVLAREGARRGRAHAYLAAITTLATEAGAGGLVGGQALDLATPAATGDSLLRIQRGKTGALFAAAASIGGQIAEAPAEEIAALATYGRAFGIAFQYADDLADGDRGDGDDARRLLDEHLAQARSAVQRFRQRDRLLDLCDLVEGSAVQTSGNLPQRGLAASKEP
jgi:geranylgeranyl pyrophosphate synthase